MFCIPGHQHPMTVLAALYSMNTQRGTRDQGDGCHRRGALPAPRQWIPTSWFEQSQLRKATTITPLVFGTGVAVKRSAFGLLSSKRRTIATRPACAAYRRAVRPLLQVSSIVSGQALSKDSTDIACAAVIWLLLLVLTPPSREMYPLHCTRAQLSRTAREPPARAHQEVACACR